MGVLRKSTSLFTMGLVDFKSDKERIAASSKKTERQAKKQTKLLKEQNKLLKD